ncbi:hypothetical protein E4U58_001637 [Claviceps cyperi]|nr:hypothetical protein E4U58_001637 [Claviceps cyperi]
MPSHQLPSLPLCTADEPTAWPLSAASWSADDSRRTLREEDVHRVMEDACDHDDHATQDSAHIALEQQHNSRFESDGVRYRASHSHRHRSTPSTPVVSPRASPPASESRVSQCILARQVYLVKLCRALIMYGAPKHRLEEYIYLHPELHDDRLRLGPAELELVRVSEGIDHGRLQDVHDINMDVAHDRLGVEEAARRLDEVLDKRPMFEVWFLILIYGLASACVAPFAFKGRLIDLPIAFILGCIVGLLQLVFAANGELACVSDFLAAAITSFLARGFGSINDEQLFCPSTLAQSSLVMNLPGSMFL